MGRHFCFRCGEEIEGEYHLDHIKAWQEIPEEAVARYFDFNNLWLSHPECNSAAKKIVYKFGCQIKRAINRFTKQASCRKKYNQTKKLDKR